MSDDPWSDLAVPEHGTSISARRVNETNRWDFYWGRDSDRRCLLVLRHNAASSPHDRLPRLKGVDIFVQPGDSKIRPSLVLRLLDSTLRDIFHRLCSDIIESASRAVYESQAVATTVARTWRWHHLLRGGGSGVLSIEEQQGLIGELLVMERYLLPALSCAAAVAAWRGPLGAPQDFIVGHTAVESKARGASVASEVFISSEYQLDDHAMESLFLHLCVFHAVSAEEPQGFTVADVVSRLRERIMSPDVRLADRYDALLTAAGFRFDDDYSQARWTGGERSIHLVNGAFPRLTPGKLPAGIARVRYELSLVHCSSFLVSPAVLEAAIAAELP